MWLIEHDPGPSSMIDTSPTRCIQIEHDLGPSDIIHVPLAQHIQTEHGPGPPSMQVNTISIEATNGDGFEEVMTRQELQEYTAHIRTMYKRKGKKILPANVPLPDGINPGGGVNKGVNTGDNLGSSGKTVPRGSRLTSERLAKMKIGTNFLSKAEKQLFIDILFDHEGAVAFDDSEMGLLHPDIEPPVTIHTVPHSPWQQQNLRLPKSMQEAATAIIKEKLENGTLEFSQGPYRNRYFLVLKQNGTWRLINDVQQLNKITIRDSGMPPSVDEFSEDFAGYPISSAIDYYSGYYEISLDKKSRDLTAFYTDLGLVRMTRLPQGWTNSVACFQRVMAKVHWRQIPHHVRPFLDDCGIKGPKDRYNDEEISPGVRRFVYEHAQIFRQFMHDCWSAGLTISGAKSAIGMSGINIVGFMCDYDGRRTDHKKVQKIVDWPTPCSVKDARGFIGIVVYYRIFIVGFAIIAAPIFMLFRKGVRFLWTAECQLAMNTLKKCITEAPVLISLDFSLSALPIILHVDASSSIGWGAILSQLQKGGELHPARFESGIWSNVERKYDALKLECRGLLKALKKLRFWLFGRYFSVRTDSQTLVWLLNQPPNDLPNAMMTRWLSYIRLFDFDVTHIPGNKNNGADALSRRGKAPEDDDEEDENEADDYFDAKLYEITATGRSVNPVAQIYLHEAEYDGNDLVLGRYLETLQRPRELTDLQYQQLRKKTRNFLVRDGYLFKRSNKHGIPPRRVVGLQEQKLKIIQELHDEIGHRGKKNTFDQISRRYQWKGLYEDVANYVKSCEECQRRARVRYEEPLHPTWSILVWEKVGIDVVHMPPSEGFGYIVFARDDLSGWVEGRAIRAANSKNVAKFIYEDIICRHGCPQRIVMDGGSENMDLTRDLLEHYRIRRTIVSAYHPQANGLVERGHDSIVNSLSKYSKSNWKQYLPLALWADRVSVRRSTGYSAFELVYGRECLLPVQFSVMSWNMVDWEEVHTREELLLARMRQLDEKTLTEAQAAKNLYNSRKANKAYFDQHKRLRGERQQLQVGDLVLLHNTKKLKTYSSRDKLDDNWFGPYRIWEIAGDSTFYRLEELDGTHLAANFAGNRLKKFFIRETLGNGMAGAS